MYTLTIIVDRDRISYECADLCACIDQMRANDLQPDLLDLWEMVECGPGYCAFFRGIFASVTKRKH